jgi:hypothetical protein
MDTKPQTQNPLAKHFRQPAIYISLPSLGRWWPDGSLDLPENKEIPVYPMTTKDEVLLRTPDALMNGSGVVGVIQSCCPNIKDAWKMPSIDVDPILIAIRIASYGHRMDFSGTCPHCKENNEYAVDLRTVNDGMKCPDFDQPVQAGPLKIVLQPQQYFAVNKTNLVRYEEQRMLSIVTDDNIDSETKQQLFSESMAKLNEMNVENLIHSVACIETEDGEQVTDAGFIREFFEQTDARVIRTMQTRLSEMAEEANVKPLKVSCISCNQAFDIQITFDYASFFAVGS